MTDDAAAPKRRVAVQLAYRGQGYYGLQYWRGWVAFLI